jgi:hypothetical protein
MPSLHHTHPEESPATTPPVRLAMDKGPSIAFALQSHAPHFVLARLANPRLRFGGFSHRSFAQRSLTVIFFEDGCLYLLAWGR